MRIVGPTLQREKEVEAILRSLPRWFGLEEPLLRFAAESLVNPTFGAEIDGTLVGFLTLKRHYEPSWEVQCMAVAAPHRNAGVGSTLLVAAERHVRAQGARFLQVKTVAETSPSLEYAETRGFYLARGFVPLEAFPALWDPSNPALQLIKALPEA